MNPRNGGRLAAGIALMLCAGAAFAADPVLKQIESEFIRIGEQLRPIVVNIDVQGPVSQEANDALREQLERLFGMPVPEDEEMPPYQERASGSGFIFDKQGHIITNNHVVQGAEKITVRLWDGQSLPAKVIGQDPQTDVAVVKIETTLDLPVAVLGDSDSVRVGQFAVAVGNPRRLEGSLSYGHVTALGRELHLPGLRFEDFIQTDAAINLGNSGGPLCNIDGEVIGINTAIVFGADSLGFAVPVNSAKRVVPELIAKGRVTRGYLGVNIVDADELYAEAVNLPDDQGGAYVDGVRPGTPAEAAGIQVYDVIRKVNGDPVRTSQELVSRISELAPDADVVLEVWRDGAVAQVQVKLDEFPDNEAEPEETKEVLGIKVESLTPQIVQRLGIDPATVGVVVTSVRPGTAAAEAGLRPGDVIVEVAKKPVTDAGQFRQLVQDHAVPGKVLLLRVARMGDTARTIVFKVPEAESPSE